MKKIMIIITVTALFATACTKLITDQNPNAETVVETTLARDGDAFHKQGVHSLAELDQMRSTPNHVVTKLSDASYNLFRSNLMFYDDVVISYRYSELASELSTDEYNRFFQIVLGMNPPSDNPVSINPNYPTYTRQKCIDDYVWNGKKEDIKENCIPEKNSTCCYEAKKSYLKL